MFPNRPKISANSLLLKRAMEGVHPSAAAVPSDRRKLTKTPTEVESEKVEDDKDDLRSVIVSHRSFKQREERKREMAERHINTEEGDIIPAKKVKQSLVFDNEGETERETVAMASLKEKAIKRWASCVESVSCFAMCLSTVVLLIWAFIDAHMLSA